MKELKYTLKRQKHNSTGTRIYNIYRGLKNRCFNPNDYHYKWYGARGVTICEEWLNNYKSFETWALNNGYQDTLTIDRIDNNGNYEPSNCRWITRKEQSNNKRTNHLITINGETKNITEWAENVRIDRKVIERRLKKGIEGVDLLKQPSYKKDLRKILQLTLDNKPVKIWNSLQEINNELGLNKSHIAEVCKKKKNYKTCGGFKWEYIN